MVDPKGLDNLPLLPRDEEGPVFEEPWQAQVTEIYGRENGWGHSAYDIQLKVGVTRPSAPGVSLRRTSFGR